jgi:hypothetical protein
VTRSVYILALALPVLCGCSQNAAAVDPPPHPQPPTTEPDVVADVPYAYEVENTGASVPRPVFPSFDRLPTNPVLPDPFRSFDGSDPDLRFASWSRRRAEIKASIETFEIGPKPDPSEVDVTASFAGGVLTVHVTRKSNQRSVTLASPIHLPSGDGPFPAVIGMAFRPGQGTGSLPADIFTSRNVARIDFLHDQVTTYGFGGQGARTDDPYFQLYPEYSAPGNVGQYSAWSWGVSRLIDGLAIASRQAVDPLPIDPKRLAVTGCSYAGKMALFAGAFDERVALTIAQESGGGGAPAWRVSHGIEPDGSVEKIDNTNGTWFIQEMKSQFSGDNVHKLPHDHHELMAMVAPRALLVTGNTDFTWLSNRSAYVSARAAHEVYRTFGIGNRFGFYIDGGHGHCAIPATQRPAIEAFVDRFLLNREVSTDVQTHPYPAVDYLQWMPWRRAPRTGAG